MGIHTKPLPDHIRGSVEGLVIIKHRFGKTILTIFPDMSRVVFSEKQKAEQRRFADAVAYAKAIIKDPQKKAAYMAKLPAGKKVLNAAISDYMRGKVEEGETSSESVLGQLSYAQTEFLLNQNRRRTEPGIRMEETGTTWSVLSLNSDPPGIFNH